MAITCMEAAIYLVAMCVMLMLEAGKACLSLLGIAFQTKPPVARTHAVVQTLPVAAPKAATASPIDAAQGTFDFRQQVTGDEGRVDASASEPPPASTLLSAPTPVLARKAVSFKKQFIGTLMDFGVGEFSDTRSKAGSNSRKYQSFYVTVELDDGGIETKQGVELETALQQSGVEKGERIELLFLGREKIDDPEDGKSVRYRNRWRINRL